MAATLLILGVTLFLVGTVLLANDAASRGRSWFLMVLPFTGAEYVRHNWSEMWWHALLRIFGIGLVLVALGVVVAQDPGLVAEPWRILKPRPANVMVGSKDAQLNSFASSEEAMLLAIQNARDPFLSGRIGGRHFSYDRAQVSNGIITIQQGDGFLPDVEVRIVMDVNPKAITSRESWFIQPSDTDDAPEVHVSFLPADGSLPVTEIFTSGYRMDLQLARLDRYQLTGFLQLMLPDSKQSYLSGEFTAYTNNLRYVGDQVDVTHDHTDTLEYVAAQYLDTQYPENTLARVEFHDTVLRRSTGTGTTVSQIFLKDGRIEERSLQLERSDVGWSVKPGNIQVRLIQEGGKSLGAMGADGGAVDQGDMAFPLPPTQLTREELALLAGQKVTVRKVDGSAESGTLRGFQGTRLQLEKQVGSGLVEFQVATSDIQSVKLQDGRDVVLVTSTDAEVKAEAPAPSGPAPEQVVKASSASGQVIAPDVEALKVYLNKQVEITGKDSRVRTGLVTEVSATHLQLSVRVGAGLLDYFYTPAEIASVRVLGGQ